MPNPSRGRAGEVTEDGLASVPTPRKPRQSGGRARGSARDVSSRGAADSRRPLALGLLLAVLLAAIAVLSVRSGSTGARELGEIARGVLALFGLADALPEPDQTIVELRLFRTLVAIGVGAGLAFSGGLLQGVFRNELASPSILGISSGAGLGASLAVLVLGGYGPVVISQGGALGPLLVTGLGFLGALGTAWLVTVLANAGGRISVPTLLLVGIAMNAVLGGCLAAIQSFVLSDFEIARSVFAWTFGTLDDRSGAHVAIVWGGVALACVAIPFVALELDLFRAGEEDAQGLGVDTQRVKVLALGAASLSAAAAVSVAGQIAFVGLVVPHVLRLLAGAAHRTLLPLCLLGGPVFFVGADLLQRWLFGSSFLQPGVLTSLLGGPFFLFLLVRNRARLQAW